MNEREHIIRVVLKAYGFTDDALEDMTWLRGTHAHSIAVRVAETLTPASHPQSADSERLEAWGRQAELEAKYRGKAFRPL